MPDKHLSPDTQLIINAVRESREDTNKQISAMRDAQRSLKDEVQNLARGFPDGDPDSHRRYHETVIEWRELRNRIVRDALAKAGTVGFFAGAGWVLYALWTAIKMEVMR